MFLTEIIELKKKRLAISKQNRDFDELKKSAIEVRENKRKVSLSKSTAKKSNQYHCRNQTRFAVKRRDK